LERTQLCGRPYNTSHENDRQHLFLQRIYSTSEAECREFITSFGVKRDTFLCFFGYPGIEVYVFGAPFNNDGDDPGAEDRIPYLDPGPTEGLRNQVAENSENDIDADARDGGPYIYADADEDDDAENAPGNTLTTESSEEVENAGEREVDNEADSEDENVDETTEGASDSSGDAEDTEDAETNDREVGIDADAEEDEDAERFADVEGTEDVENSDNAEVDTHAASENEEIEQTAEDTSDHHGTADEDVYGPFLYTDVAEQIMEKKQHLPVVFYYPQEQQVYFFPKDQRIGLAAQRLLARFVPNHFFAYIGDKVETWKHSEVLTLNQSGVFVVGEKGTRPINTRAKATQLNELAGSSGALESWISDPDI
jgi:hypothetical protein